MKIPKPNKERGRRRASANPESADSRMQLVSAATRLFAERGFDGTTTRDIADVSGLNISLISYYFGGKDGLLRACLEQIESRLSNLDVLQLSDDRAEYFQSLGKFIAGYIRSHVENPYMHRLMQREQERDSSAFKSMVHQKYAPWYRQMSKFIEHGQVHGWVKSDLNATTAALAMVGAMVQQVRLDTFRSELQGYSLAEPQYCEEVIRDLKSIILNGLEQAR